MAKIIRSKKAVFFSLIALFMVFMFVLSFRVATRVDIEKNKISAQNTRIKVMNNLVYDLEERYFERMLYVASKAGLKAMSENKDKISILKNDLESIVLDGTFSADPALYNYYNFDYLINELQQRFTGVGLTIDKLEVEIVDLSQSGPWHVHVSVYIKYELTDDGGLAGWRGKIRKDVDVSIFGFETTDGIITKDWKSDLKCGEGYKCKDGESFLHRLDNSYHISPEICTECEPVP